MKYFFHMEDEACIRDPQGDEFSDDAAALREAVNIARGLAKEGLHPTIARGGQGREWP